MTDNETKMIKIIRESSDPEKVAAYMLNLCLDYLRTHVPSQGTPVADPRESV